MDNLLDPTTGDYTGTNTSSLANAVYLRLMIPLGSWWAQPDVGSKLHLLRREKDVTRVHKLARQWAEEALAPLTADTDGRASSITVETFQERDGWLLLLITVIQADGVTVPLSHQVRVA
ncbi:TPA: phage GP46 family protein [Yersinia enterocolitica]|nr:phage GP46 family protein [Yersinia enterocolitica]HED5569701.1 phage GP46 family protein [Yersinia enterocolitica]